MDYNTKPKWKCPTCKKIQTTLQNQHKQHQQHTDPKNRKTFQNPITPKKNIPNPKYHPKKTTTQTPNKTNKTKHKDKKNKKGTYSIKIKKTIIKLRKPRSQRRVYAGVQEGTNVHHFTRPANSHRDSSKEPPPITKADKQTGTTSLQRNHQHPWLQRPSIQEIKQSLKTQDKISEPPKRQNKTKRKGETTTHSNPKKRQQKSNKQTIQKTETMKRHTTRNETKETTQETKKDKKEIIETTHKKEQTSTKISNIQPPKTSTTNQHKDKTQDQKQQPKTKMKIETRNTTKKRKNVTTTKDNQNYNTKTPQAKPIDKRKDKKRNNNKARKQLTITELFAKPTASCSSTNKWECPICNTHNRENNQVCTKCKGKVKQETKKDKKEIIETTT